MSVWVVWCGDVGARVSIMSPAELTLDMGHVNSLVSVTTNIGTDHKLHLQITHSQHHFHEKESVSNVIQHLFLSESLCKSLLIIATLAIEKIWLIISSCRDVNQSLVALMFASWLLAPSHR